MEKDLQYWMDCLTRIPANDVFSRVMVMGKIKSLQFTLPPSETKAE